MNASLQPRLPPSTTYAAIQLRLDRLIQSFSAGELSPDAFAQGLKVIESDLLHLCAFDRMQSFMRRAGAGAAREASELAQLSALSSSDPM